MARHRVKICYFNYMEDLYGSSIGSTIKAVELLDHLEKRGFKVFYYWRFGGQPPDPPPQPGWRKMIKRPLLRRLFFTPKYILLNLMEMFAEARFLRRHRPHVIILRLDLYRFSVVWLAKFFRVPLIIEADSAMSYEWLTFNNKDGNIWPKWLYFFEKLCLRSASGIFAQSLETRDYLVHLHGLKPGDVTVITNAARILPNDPEHNNRKREELGIPGDGLVCGFLGSLHFWHGTDRLFQLMDRLLSKKNRVWFLIVGAGGPYAEQFKQRCAAKPWSSRVLFSGYVEHNHAYEYINLFDVALAPYALDGLFYYSPVKMFEYMAQGKPVVTTRVGQVGRIIRHGENGFFFQPDDPDDLFEMTLQLLSDSALRSFVGRNARRTILEGHTWDYKAAQLADLCNNV